MILLEDIVQIGRSSTSAGKRWPPSKSSFR
jgi:hypothetical protein